MKRARPILWITLCVLFTAPGIGAQELDEILRQFEENGDYVRPFATLLGTMTNAAWYQSSAVPRNFSFYIGLPISLAYIHSKDRTFDYTYVDTGCIAANSVPGSNTAGCVGRQALTLPTILGTDPAPKAAQSQADISGNVVRVDSVLFSDGIEPLNQIPLMPFATFQIGLSYFYTELKARYIGVPIPAFSLHLPGVGLQHDLASVLPEIPVSISVAGNITWYRVSWAPPADDITGELELSGFSAFAGVLAGYRIKFLEVFLEAGWEHSKLTTGGSLTIAAQQAGGQSETISPGLELKGRNVFRAALNVAIPLGWMPVIGGQVGAEFGNTVNILGYKYRGKDKGTAAGGE